MGFFKKKAKENFDVTSVSTEGYDKLYENVFKALEGEFGEGAKDTKEAVFYFDDVNYLIRFADGKIKIVFTMKTIDLENRLSYEFDPEKFDTLPKSLTAFDLIDNYESIVNHPDSDKIKGIFRDYSLSNMRELESKFKNVEKVRSKIITNQSSVDSLLKLDFLDLSINELKSEFARLDKFSKEIENDFGTSLDDLSVVKLKTIIMKERSTVPVDNFVVDVSSTEISLEDLKKSSQLFVWEDVLDAALRLDLRDIIKIDFPGRSEIISDFLDIDDIDKEIKDSLPMGSITVDGKDIMDFDEVVTENNDLTVHEVLKNAQENSGRRLNDEVLEGIILEPVDEVIDEDYPESVYEDDGKFFYEEVQEQTRTFAFKEDIEKDIIEAINSCDLDEKLKIELEQKARQNSVLEEELSDLEGLIELKRSKFSSSLNSLDNLKFSAEMKLLGSDKALQIESPDEFKNIENSKDKTSEELVKLESLESNRYLVNIERKILLQRILEIVSHMNHQTSETVIKKIEAKLSEIEHVVNVAFTSPEDPEHGVADPELMKNVTQSKVQPSRILTPIFYKIVDNLGYNPFE